MATVDDSSVAATPAVTGEKRGQPKYLQIVESLRASIEAGRYRNGVRLPSEAELVRRFNVSRMTVVKAMQHLQQAGLLTRRTGSGTYASENSGNQKPVFGLLIPDLGQTEIFEPICKGMAASPNAGGHSLSWGHSVAPSANKEDEAEHLCQQYVDQRVSGVFFAPVEFGQRRDQVNRRVLKMLKSARIPVVLLDKCVLDYPARSDYDLVGLDNRRAGYLMTDHLIRQGARQVGFLAIEGSAETVDDRIVGYREACYAHGRELDRRLVLRGDPGDAALLSGAIASHGIDALLCANDHTAALAMRTLLGLGLRIPEDIRIVGIDDVRYAGLLPVPLTTFHQPCLDIGAAALAAMLDRIANPHLPARSILLNGSIVVRESCGAPKA
ncbi:DNA-binding transcriptional regulator, LacI/PurR family [Granulicella rosea]|uniref:DNA-binding transcriptional regulator, LacI/PurR family n=1 Tax=Granulicella rosea TaxID=474952 RepID=A0A239DVR3_9BACT|nr:GntR family transcriptional regulator [Granulicella rosea]SNS35812.1 DNA-binding transcriptional regulator, LacI/PurR family [Granulicella rosea]